MWNGIKNVLQHRIKFMLKSDLVQTDKHSIKILLQRKNLRFLRRTNLIQNRCSQFQKKHSEPNCPEEIDRCSKNII
jgi:hypothetical protein